MLQGGGKKPGTKNINSMGMYNSSCANDFLNSSLRFMTTSKVGSVDAIKQAVRRAVVEVLTLKNARKRLTYATRMPVDEIVNISHFKFLKTANGTILMDFQGSKKQHDTLASIPNDSTVLGADTLSKMRANGEVSEEPSESIRIPRNISTSQDSNAEEPSLAGTTGTLEFEAVDDEIWMELSLEDQMMKFAVGTVCAIALTDF